MKFMLNTGRTIWQGEAIEAGKNLELYKNAAAVCYMNAGDMLKLGVRDGDTIEVTSEYGNVVVSVITTKEEAPAGMIFIPMGPWANRIVLPDTESTAMPSYKGPIAVDVEKTDKKVLIMTELMRQAYLE
ncbi:formylmethanofuran dehydrogenase subunit D [Methanococcus voltae]|uniref:Formylmethanofuran dehydrogenase subunit D n=1 Tax=Methanococcus voltae TaxID=2188 RepID=A0A8J7UQT5_METVO|nr:tungsten-dependent formylmethanofuran dehydrogenase subunit FwdD [Methanococcus voltae]MBP2201103.1 formylmethanofuran dehydrogenase subunit D [Methanococcus voltae]